MSTRITRTTRGVALLLAPLAGAVGCSFVGIDTTRRPDLCVLVAPVGLRPVDVRESVTAVVDRAAAAHAAMTVIVAVGPSGAAFERVVFSEHANGGAFASKAANPAARDKDARRWAKAAQHEIMAALEPTVLEEGLDLIGGVQQCGDELGTDGRHPTLVIVSTGLHRTKDLDLSDGNADTAATVTADLVAAVPPPLALHLYEIGHFDPAATKGPIARSVAATVRSAWAAACDALQDRCTVDIPGGHS